ncbi:hypothetical protein N5D48_05965 [Pseudomonas sp. GD03858]|uniref:hypothetical protein n=1 Tax=unclassified Pseudomonas TaxID=196821 RepID=UPI00244AD732|nr:MULTISPECIES: hypothetical protein [unclassified Pseudomonas]MDH0649928.1 hypothetical protein [Pseudomonas sp. GD03867]MDH0661939.1 hypothetical protein [Pseudomonas sp. GD03858]
MKETLSPSIRYLTGLALLLTLAACSSTAPPGLTASSSATQLDERGRQAVGELRRWYNSTTDDCGGPDKPAYLCSGLALRTTASSPDFLPWDPTDNQLEKGSVAFSWVRRDNNFASPANNRNGLLLYPPQAVPAGKIADLNVLCTFPINANTNQRRTLQGCGAISGFETTTDTCMTLGIGSAQQWLGAYPQARNFRVCGWDLRQQRNDAARWFQTAIQARAGMSAANWAYNNEVLLPVWPRGKGGELPVHSFFYIEGDRVALAKAQYDQIRYAQHYQQWLPVVRVTFPVQQTDGMTFGYLPEDQAAGRPTPTPSITFEDQPVGARSPVTSQGVEFALHRLDHSAVSDELHENSAGRITGKHLAVDSTIHFVLEGAGRRLVSFSWGCNTSCAMQTAIGQVHVSLDDDELGEMRYGRQEFIIDGPEAFGLTVDSTDDAGRLVLDNLSVQALPEK